MMIKIKLTLNQYLGIQKVRYRFVHSLILRLMKSIEDLLTSSLFHTQNNNVRILSVIEKTATSMRNNSMVHNLAIFKFLTIRPLTRQNLKIFLSRLKSTKQV